MINPNEIKLRFLKEIEGVNNVLDLCCGDGNISKYFLDLGCNVTGIDKKPLELNHPNFKFLNIDLREYKFENIFDCIIGSLFLHYFKPEGSRQIINKIKDITQEGGYNFLVILFSKDSIFKAYKDNFFPDQNELREIYNDWELIDIEEGFTDKETHDNLPEHDHHIILALFKKI